MKANALWFLNCILFINSADHDKYYKVSMVASAKDPMRPAVYGYAKSPVWDHVSQSLLFVDVEEQNVHRLDYHTGKITTKHIEYGPATVVATILNTDRILVCVRASVYVMNWEENGDAALRPITSVDFGHPSNFISEGKSDPKGRFWFGTRGPQKGELTEKDRGTLYSVHVDNPSDVRVQVRPLSVFNGIVWSLNHTVLYYIDSATQKIEAFDFDVNKGTISRRRTILDVTEYGYEESTPDGVTIDSKGNLWVALMYGGTVLHINPDTRHVIYGYKMPVSRTTSLVWGGPNLDELFVTTSRLNTNVINEPLAGAVFTIRDTGSNGVPTAPFTMPGVDNY